MSGASGDLGSMEPTELLRMLTLERGDYTPERIAGARSELARLGLTLEKLLDDVTVTTPGGAPERVDRAGAHARFLAASEPWTQLVVRRALGDALTAQRQLGSWAFHLSRAGGDYVGVRAFTGDDAARAELDLFLSCDGAWRESAERYGLEGWDTILESRSFDVLAALAGRLADAGVPYALAAARGAEGTLFASSQPGAHGVRLQLLVPEAEAPRAREALAATDDEIDALFAEAERHAGSGDSAKELACYERLAALSPEDGMVHFNLGAIRMDAGDREAAADAFMDALPYLGRDEKLAPYVTDVASNLREILPHHPKPSVLRHCLANIALSAGEADDAESLCREILAADARDPLAHLLLGQILYQNGDRDEEAARAFGRYLALEPDADDRPAIEALLEELG